jgi:hypothetical protein
MIVTAMPPTQVSVEQLFSALKIITSVLRASMKDEMVEANSIPKYKLLINFRISPKNHLGIILYFVIAFNQYFTLSYSQILNVRI